MFLPLLPVDFGACGLGLEGRFPVTVVGGPWRRSFVGGFEGVFLWAYIFKISQRLECSISKRSKNTCLQVNGRCKQDNNQLYVWERYTLYQGLPLGCCWDLCNGFLGPLADDVDDDWPSTSSVRWCAHRGGNNNLPPREGCWACVFVTWTFVRVLLLAVSTFPSLQDEIQMSYRTTHFFPIAVDDPRLKKSTFHRINTSSNHMI